MRQKGYTVIEVSVGICMITIIFLILLNVNSFINYLNGKRHRLDGPACEYANGYKGWYIDGKRLTENQFLKATQPAKELTVAEIEKLLGHRVKIVK